MRTKRQTFITALVTFALTCCAIGNTSSADEPPHRVAIDVARELIADRPAMSGRELAPAFDTLLADLSARYAGDPVAALDARLGVLWVVTNGGYFNYAERMLERCLRDAMAIGEDSPSLDRTLFMQGKLGVEIMLAVADDTSGADSRETLARGRTLIRAAAADAALDPVHRDWLNVIWATFEPLPAAQVAVARRAVNGGKQRGDARVVIAAGFAVGVQSLTKTPNAELAAEFLSEAEAAANQADFGTTGSVIALLSCIANGADPSDIDANAIALIDLIPAAHDTPREDIAMLGALAGYLSIHKPKTGVSIARHASACATAALADGDALRNAIMLSETKLEIAAGERAQPDPPMPRLNVSLKFSVPASPWDLGDPIRLEATIKLKSPTDPE